MKTLKKKFSIYQSSQKVRKLWCDYNEAKAAIDSPFGSSSTSAGSNEGDGFDAETSAIPPSSVPSSGSIAAGQGPVRALRVFVDAVDLADARQTAVLQNLDDLGQGELVTTLVELAGSSVGTNAHEGSLSLSPTASDVALAEKSLTIVQICLSATISSNPRKPTEWKEHLRHLVAILAAEEGAPDGHMLVPLNTDMCRRMMDVKAVALRVIELVAADHERVVEVGRCGGFQAIARLALPRRSQLRPQAVGMLASFVATSPPGSDPSRPPPEARGRTGRWGSRVGRFGASNNGGTTNASRSPRFQSDGMKGEEEGALEASVASSSSSTSFADAASYVYSSLQALVSSGRDAGETPSPSMFEMAAGGGGAFPENHLPMAVLPQSIAEEASRLSAMAARSEPAYERSGTCYDSAETEKRLDNGYHGPFVRQERAGSIVDTGDVAKMMHADGALEVFADAISPRLACPEGKAGEVRAFPPSEAQGPEVHDGVCLRLEALEAAVAMLEGRPFAQAEFTRLGGYSRICSFVHDVAAGSNQGAPLRDTTPSCDPVDERGRSRSKSNPDRLSRGEGEPVTPELQVLDGAFDAIFRLALDGHAVARGARADGADTVKTLLLLAARSPSLPVALRAARSLQALLRVRPMNAVSLERQSALRIVADAVSGLAFSEENSGEGFGDNLSGEKGKAKLDLEWEEAVHGRLAWSVDDKREALSSMNEVVRVMAAVYSRQDARALERYAGILLSLSTARFGASSNGERIGARCSICGVLPAGATENALQRCLLEGCKGAAGLCRACDDALHKRADEDSHVRVPLATRTTCQMRRNVSQNTLPPLEKADPAWALEAGKALMKAMTVMLDDRESFGLPLIPDTKRRAGQTGATAAGETPLPATNDGTTVLASMLQVVQDELLEPLNSHRGINGHSPDSTVRGEELPATRPPHSEGELSGDFSDVGGQINLASSGSGWTSGWLLDALEIVARFVVRGDRKTVEMLGAEGGWGLLAHISRLPVPPPHLAAHRSSVPTVNDHGGDHEGRTSNHTSTIAGSIGDGGSRHNQNGLSEAWVGWIGARRLSLWIIREALLTGTAGQCRSGNSSSSSSNGADSIDLLVQPARWLAWLVRAVMRAALPSEDRLAKDQVLMKLAVLNELRLAIGSFAPCEVVMEGCTRVLPLVALPVASSESNVPLTADDEGRSYGEAQGRSGLSPNRHPQARSGAANVKVVGRLAGDQRGVVLDALVSEGMMEALLTIVEGNSSLSTDSSAAESGLALMLLADLASGSEKAKARLGSVLGYDILAEAAHAAGAVIHSHQYSLWLEASLRRIAGTTARLASPFERLVTDPSRALAVAITPKATPSLDATHAGRLRTGTNWHEIESGSLRGALGGENSERGRTESRTSTRRRGWRRRSPGSREGAKDGMAWVPRALPKLSHSLGRGTAERMEEEDHRDVAGAGARREKEGRIGAASEAHKFDELWLPPGLVTLAQDVLLINRARGGVVARGEEQYFIAQARGAPSGSGYPLWKLGASKFRGLEAAVFPFLLLPLVPCGHQPQAAEQLSRLLDANPANAAALCHLRVPLALLKLACLLPEQSQVRDLYFRLAAQLMSHHISPSDALELFHLASLQPSAWARLGRLRVTSGASLVSARHLVGGVMLEEEVADAGDQVCVRQGRGDDGVVMPPNSGELQMQLLYVIGTVVDSPSPAWFFHLDGSGGSGLVAGPLLRFPPKRIGYSLSMWFRPAWFSGRPGGETALFSIYGGKEEGAIETLLRVSLRRCERPGDNSAPPAAAGIGASEDDDGDQGIASEDACAKLQVHATTKEVCPDQQSNGPFSGGVIQGATVASALVTEPDVRCGRWQYLVLTHSYSSDAAGNRKQWMDGSITVYVDGERRTLANESAGGKRKRNNASDRGALAYPADAAGGCGGSISASVGCWEEDSGVGRELVTGPPMEPGIVSPTAARFSGQMATVALVEGAWTAETAKASFLRGPGAPPPGKRIVFASPGDLPPTPFLDAVGDLRAPSVSVSGQCKFQEGPKREVCSGGNVARAVEGEPVENDDTSVTDVGEVMSLPGRDRTVQSTARAGGSTAGVATYAGTPSAPLPGGPKMPAISQHPSSQSRDAPRIPRRPLDSEISVAPPRLSVVMAPLRKAIDLKYGVAPAAERNGTGSSSVSGGSCGGEGGSGDGTDASAGVSGGGVDVKSALLADSMASTVNSLAVAAGCGGKDKDSSCDGRVSFRLASGSGTWVYATTPLHAAVQAAGGFRLCLPFLRMDHARQVAALRVLAGLLEASAEGMDAFRVRDGFNVLYHALAQEDHALEQLSMDTFDTLFELMTSEALQGALDVSASNLSPVTLLDVTGRTADTDDVRASYLASGCVGVKPVRSPEALRLVVDLLGHCERKPDLQARMMEALVDALDGSSTGIQVWRKAFNESGAFAPLLYLLSPPAFPSLEAAPSLPHPITDITLGGGGGGNIGSSARSGLSLSRRTASFSMSSSGPGGIATVARDTSSNSSGVKTTRISSGERPTVAAGAIARTQTTRMLQVLIAGSAAVAPAVRPQDPSASVASTTSAGCTLDQLADLVGFVLRCHLEVEELYDIVRLQVLNTGQDDKCGVPSGRRAFAEGSAQSRLALTRQISRTVVDLLVQLCGGDGGAVLVGMMSQAFPSGGNFLVALELLSSSHVETRVSAIKLLSLMLVRKGNDGRRPSASTFFSTDDSAAGGGRPGPDPQALRAFEKLGGFTAMGRQLERHTTCQVVCDALMGMIFGVWGSKHEPRPIREKDVLAIKGNKESWLRAWWSSYSSPPDEVTNTATTNPNVAGTAAAGTAAAEGSSSIVDRFRSSAAAAASSGSAPATTASDQNGSEDGNPPSAVVTATAKGVASGSGADSDHQDDVPDVEGGTITVTLADKEARSNGGIAAQGDGQSRDTADDVNRTPVTTPPRSFLKPGIFTMKSGVDTSNHGGDSAKSAHKGDKGAGSMVHGTSGETEIEGKAVDLSKGGDKDKEEKSFLSGLLRRLSIEPSGGDERAVAAVEASAPRVFAKTFPPSLTEVAVAAERDAASAAVDGPSSSKKRTTADKRYSTPDKAFDSLHPEARDSVEQRRSDTPAAVEETNGGDDGDGRDGGGGSSGDCESLNLVLPEAVEVLMRALQRAQSPTVVSRCLLQLESAVAWLPAAPAPDEDRGAAGRTGVGGNRKDFGGRGSGADEEGTARSGAAGKAAAGGGGGSAAGKNGTDGGDRERNADVLMSRQGWLVWCQRLVEALSARNDSGDLAPRRGPGASGYGHGVNDSMDMGGGGGDRWGTGGSEASEAGGYLDDSHSETTDTGSAFSYLESSSVGQSAVLDGGSGALEAFTGPVYGLVAALLEQDMARAPRDKRGHRFLELFHLSNGSSFQAAVLEDALDGVQDSPMLSMDGVQSSRPSSRTGGGAGNTSGDVRADESVQRMESLRELLVAALHHHPDLPLGLCVKSVHTINLLGYHGSHEARSRMKSVGLLRVRDDLIRRCLFHPVAAAWEKVSALSQVEDALETLVSQTNSEAEAVAAGEVALQLLHLFVEITAHVVSLTTSGPTSTTAAAGGISSSGYLSPMARSSNSAAVLAGRRAMQVAAARALGRVAVASSVCRSTVIHLAAKDQQLLVRLLPALRCPLTMEELEDIELGNFPEALPLLSGSSRWSLGSLSLLPTSTGPTTSVSCMSDDADEPSEGLPGRQSPQRNKAFFPPTPPTANGAGSSWPPSVPGGGMSSYFAGSSSSAASGGTSGSFGGGVSGSGTVGGSDVEAGGCVAVSATAKPPPAASAAAAAASGAGSGASGGLGGASSSSPYRLDEVLEEEEDEIMEQLAPDDDLEEDEQEGEEVEIDLSEATETAAAVAVTAAEAGEEEEAGAGTLPGSEPEASAFRRRPRRRSSSDVSNGSVGGAGASGSSSGLLARLRPVGGGGSWHDPNGGTGRRHEAVNVGGGWGVPEHHDLQAFVQWYSDDGQSDIRDGLRRRVNKALAPLSKARGKIAGKQASKREKAVRQAQKREQEATAAKEKAATESLVRCRIHAEKTSDRTTAAVDAWCAERRRRWEAGKTRGQELAPSVLVGGSGGRGGQAGAVVGGGTALDNDGMTNSVYSAGATVAVPPGGSATACDNGGVGGLCSDDARGGRQHAGPAPATGGGAVSSSWNWERRAGEGVSFRDFFETFAGAGDEDVEEVGLVSEPHQSS